RGDEVVVLADPKKDLSESLESPDVIHLLVENPAQKIYRFVFLALGDQYLYASIDLLGCPVQIAGLQEAPPHLEQIVIAVLVQLNQAKKGLLGIIHHSGREIRSAQNS